MRKRIRTIILTALVGIMLFNGCSNNLNKNENSKEATAQSDNAKIEKKKDLEKKEEAKEEELRWKKSDVDEYMFFKNPDNGDVILNLSKEEKSRDYDYLIKIIKENYPYLDVNKRANGVDWLAGAEQFREEIVEAETKEEFAQAISKSLQSLNNWHTGVFRKDFYDYAKKLYSEYPGREEWFNELNRPEASTYYEGKAADVKKGENGDDGKDDLSSKDNIITDFIENSAYIHIRSFNHFNVDKEVGQINEFLQKAKDYDSLIIDIRGNGGGDTEYWRKLLVPKIISKSVFSKTYTFYRGGEFTKKYMYEFKDVEYLLESYDGKKMDKLAPEISRNFKYYDKTNRLYKPDPDSINFEGNIYLLVDKMVYSASEAFAIFCKNTSFATLIGCKTAGDGIGIDPAVCTLPNSGLVFRFTFDFGTTADGTCNEEFKTEPDYEVEYYYNSDYKKDKCVQKALELSKMNKEESK